MSYKNLEVWQMAREVVIDIHQMTLRNLPKFEMYEEGNQIRRSSKSVKLNPSLFAKVFDCLPYATSAPLLYIRSFTRESS